MLVSQLALASQVPITPLLLQAATIPSAALLRSSISRRNRHQQQTRNFRFSLWTSYLDPEFQKELQRRNRIIKHKYAEALNRKLSWDWKHPIQSHRRGFKGFVCGGWRGQDPRPGGRWVDVSELKSVTEGPRAGHGIEDVEQAALEKLWAKESRAQLENAINEYTFKFTQWAIPASDLGGQQTTGKPAQNRPREPETAKASATETAVPELEYDIDPISNRKVFRKAAVRESEMKPTSTSPSPKTFKGYRSQFSAFEPPAVNAEPKVIHLDSQPSFNPSHKSASTSRTGEISSFVYPTAEELDAHKQSKYCEPEAKRSEKVEGPSKEELDKYKPFKFNEPDGRKPEKLDDLQPTQEELSQYKPFKYNEPDGQPAAQPLTYVEEYEDLDGYKPFKYNEPDGQLPHKPEQVKGRLYSNGFINSEEFVHSCYPIQFSEIRKSVASSAETEKFEDPDLLRASDIRASSGIMKGPRKESDAETQATRRKLEEDYSKDPLEDKAIESEIRTAQKFREHYVKKLEKQRQEKLIADRQRFQVELNDLKNLTTRARFLIHKKLDQLQFDYEMAPDHILQGKRNRLIERAADELVTSGELGNDVFTPHSSNDYKREALERWIRDAVAEKENKMFRATIGPVTPKKMTGNFVRDFPEEFAKSWTTEGSTSDSLVPKIAQGDVLREETPKHSQSGLSFQQYSGNASAARIQTSLDRSKLNDKELAAADQYSKNPTGLELSYAKEREENGDSSPTVFASSYEPSTAKSVISTKTDTQVTADIKRQRDKELIREVRDIYESKYGTIDSKHRQLSEDPTLQPAATDKAEPAAAVDKVGMADEARIPRAKVLARRGVLDEHVKLTPQLPVPTIYKILAYDPVMQAINIAETTSIVPDISSALTPADVLLRLSNPAKFFPHFQPLQSQGYEIVSGSGDVLVFRKVRDGSPPTTSRASTSLYNSETNLTNPIDGMQTIRPATGNFASPTGFVNHDLPEPSPSEAPFKSNIDVRREEAVFSGRNSGWQESAGGSSRKGWSTMKRVLAGAGTVAASSYAIGVVIEFFRTGGVDGKGPQGI